MKWLTIEQVKKHATTPRKALNISIRHWQQIVDTTAREMKELSVGSLFPAALCGLCVYYICCDEERCPLAKSGNGCCKETSQYDIVSYYFSNWRKKTNTFREFKTEARKMLKLLKSLKVIK